MKYKQWLTKRAELTAADYDSMKNHPTYKSEYANKVSPGEIATTAIGAGVGGLGAYILSKALSKNTSTLGRIFHVLAGAGVGGFGANAMLDAINYRDAGSLREALRLGNYAASDKNAADFVRGAMDTNGAGNVESGILAKGIGGTSGALLGGAAGYRGSRALRALIAKTRPGKWIKKMPGKGRKFFGGAVDILSALLPAYASARGGAALGDVISKGSQNAKRVADRVIYEHSK